MHLQNQAFNTEDNQQMIPGSGTSEEEKKVDLIETIRQIPHGETVQFARQELGPEGSVRSAVWRLNDRLKKLTGRQEPEYSLELVDMGLFYNITRA